MRRTIDKGTPLSQSTQTMNNRPFKDIWERPYTNGTYQPGQIIRTTGNFSWIVGRFVRTFTDTFDPDVTWVEMEVLGERHFEGDYVYPQPYRRYTVRHEFTTDFPANRRKSDFPKTSRWLPPATMNAPKRTYRFNEPSKY